MKTNKLAALFIVMACLCWGNGNVFAEEAYDYWLNPAYRNLYPETFSSPKTTRDSGTPTLCTSYDAFKAAAKTNLNNRLSSFAIQLKYDFLFSEILNISDKAFEEILGEDDYLAFNNMSRKTNVSGNSGNVTITYTLTYLTTYDQEQKVSARVSEILAQIITSSMKDNEKTKAIHDWVVLNVRYDTELVQYSAYAALFLGKAVCQGYTLLVFKMLKEAGVTSKIVDGMGYGNGAWDNHTWNLVYLCGNWYHVDATFDDPVPDVSGRVRYTYFEKSDAEMSDHIWDTTKYPAASVSYSDNICTGNTSGNTPENKAIVWQTSKSAAVSLAKSQGKKILLFAGRETCGNCQYMKYTACESASPPIKSLIEQYFIPWFSDIDNSTEWYPYSSGLGSFSLPLIAVIDPNDSDNYLDQTTDVQDIEVFHDRLSKYISGAVSGVCFATDDALGIGVTCARYQGIQYGFKLDYKPVQKDASGFYWKIDPLTISVIPNNTTACVTISSDLKLPVCAEYHGLQYEFTLDFTPVSADPMSIYWKADISTFKQKK